MTDQFDRKAASKQFSRVGWGIFAFLAVPLVVLIAAILIMSFLRLPVIGEGWFLIALNLVSMYVFGLPVTVAIIKNRPAPKISAGRKMTTGEFLTSFCIVIGITYAGNIIGNILMAIVQVMLGKSIDNPLDILLDGTSIGIQLFSVLVVAPLLEEFIFRKCVVTALAKYSHGGAILISGLAFGICHGNFYQFFYAFAIGIVFAYLYLKTGRLRYTIALHFLVNFLGGAVPLLLQDGLSALEEIATLENLTAAIALFQDNGLEILLLLIYLLFMWGIAITGVILFLVKRKGFRLSPDRPCIPSGVRFRTMFINSGMILMILMGLFLFVTSIFE